MTLDGKTKDPGVEGEARDYLRVATGRRDIHDTTPPKSQPDWSGGSYEAYPATPEQSKHGGG